jgi:hypothetical protein
MSIFESKISTIFDFYVLFYCKVCTFKSVSFSVINEYVFGGDFFDKLQVVSSKFNCLGGSHKFWSKLEIDFCRVQNECYFFCVHSDESILNQYIYFMIIYNVYKPINKSNLKVVDNYKSVRSR